MSQLDHIILVSIMYGCFFLFDKASYNGSCRANIRGWRFFAVVSFVFVEGLRYGRGRDYFHYGMSYLQKTGHVIGQPVYDFFQRILLNIDFTTTFLPYGLLFVVLSFVFIQSLFKYGSLFKGEVKYFYFFAILATQYLFEWTIRQGLSFSFIFLSLFYWEKLKKKKALILALFGLSLHYGNIFIVLLIVTCIFLFGKKTIPLKISIPVLFILSFLGGSLGYLTYVQYVVNSINLDFFGDSFATYSNVDRWFSNDSALDALKKSFFKVAVTDAFYASTLILGSYAHKKNPKWIYVYNTYVISVCIYALVFTNEILNRFVTPGVALWFVPVSLAFYYTPYKNGSPLLKFACVFFVVYTIIHYGQFVFLCPTGSYVWSMQPIRNYFVN